MQFQSRLHFKLNFQVLFFVLFSFWRKLCYLELEAFRDFFTYLLSDANHLLLKSLNFLLELRISGLQLFDRLLELADLQIELVDLLVFDS